MAAAGVLLCWLLGRRWGAGAGAVGLLPVPAAQNLPAIIVSGPSSFNSTSPPSSLHACPACRSFLRFPGGCYVEGDWMRNAFRWKESVGSNEARTGHMNGGWLRRADCQHWHTVEHACSPALPSAPSILSAPGATLRSCLSVCPPHLQACGAPGAPMGWACLNTCCGLRSGTQSPFGWSTMESPTGTVSLWGVWVRAGGGPYSLLRLRG